VPQIPVTMLILRVRLVVPDAQVRLQLVQSVHCVSVQSQDCNSTQLWSSNKALSSGQAPPYWAAVRTARLRLWNPSPHGWLQSDHGSQSETMHSIGANVELVSFIVSFASCAQSKPAGQNEQYSPARLTIFRGHGAHELALFAPRKGACVPAGQATGREPPRQI
jgi:hypothetical protein